VYVTSVNCRVAVLASGRGSNFRALVERCQDPTFPADVVCLITDNPAAHVVEVAEEFGVPWHGVPAGERRGRLADGAEARIVRVCEEAGVGLVVLAGFMRILDGELLVRYAGRIMNIHPSLLPSFKGLNAQRQALEHGVKVAGCTVHFVDASLDGGPIILQAAVPVLDGDDADALAARILREEHRILCRAVERFARGALRVDGRRVLGGEETPTAPTRRDEG
jgi:phosphoribosylglycinamide formyltransferase-1